MIIIGKKEYKRDRLIVLGTAGGLATITLGNVVASIAQGVQINRLKSETEELQANMKMMSISMEDGANPKNLRKKVKSNTKALKTLEDEVNGAFGRLDAKVKDMKSDIDKLVENQGTIADNQKEIEKKMNEIFDGED